MNFDFEISRVDYTAHKKIHNQSFSIMIKAKLSNYFVCVKFKRHTSEFQWLEYLWVHEIRFETGVVRANED